jgi:hypothetical protein
MHPLITKTPDKYHSRIPKYTIIIIKIFKTHEQKV